MAHTRLSQKSNLWVGRYLDRDVVAE